MKWFELFMTYVRQIGNGQRTPPEKIRLTMDEPTARMLELMRTISEMGVREFMDFCAAQDETTLDPAMLDGLSAEELAKTLEAVVEALPSALSAEEVPQEEPPCQDDTPHIEEPDGPRSAYEVLLDCCLLDEKLLTYLIDVIKRNAVEEFRKLAMVTTRKAFDPADLLAWFADKESRGERDELICVTLMDAVFDRLSAEGHKELIAALLCGDRKTFELFRCDAPELLHLPDATYEWYEKNYLAGYYPVRYLLKFNGVDGVDMKAKEEQT